MKSMLKLKAILACVLIINVSPLFSQEKDKLSTLKDYIHLKLERDHIPGLAVCIVDRDGIVWSQGFGSQNLDSQIPMTPQSVMGTASVTKLVTTIAIMQLIERHQLAPNDPIDKFLPFKIRHPKYPDDRITVAQLLSHTASTSNGPSLWRCYSCGDQKMTRGKWVQAYFLPRGEYYHEEGNFGEARPGERFLYSNAGYSLLAHIVERVSGIPFELYCKENIFDPLKMNNTSFDVQDIEPSSLSIMYSYGYNMDLERALAAPGYDFGKVMEKDYFIPLCYYTTSTTGATGMFSSADQLASLLAALMNGGTYDGNRILKKESTDKIFSHYVDNSLLPPQFAEFGLGGYAMRLNNGASVWGHTGADPGQSSFMLYNTEKQIGAVVLANRFSDIRDLIEWVFAEAVSHHPETQSGRTDGIWNQYRIDQTMRKITFRVFPNYLPGGSRLFITGNHRYLGAWVNPGIPLIPQKDRCWEKTFFFPDSTRLEFKITRGGMDKQAVRMDGNVPPNHSFTAVQDTVLYIVVEDWKDQVQ